MICRKGGGTSPGSDAGVPSSDMGAPSPGGPDVTPPAVSITSPADKAAVTSPVTIKTKVTDSGGIAKVELYMCSTMMASKTSPPFDFTIVLMAGGHNLKVVAYDKAKNKAEAKVFVTVGGAPAPPKLDTGGGAPTTDAGPGQPGASQFGSACVRSTDCQSNICAFDSAYDARYCTQKCGIQGWCPPGATCLGGAGSAQR